MPVKPRRLFNIARRAIRVAFVYGKRAFDRKRFIAPPVPALSLEVTSVCNSRCVFCANSVMQRPRQHMPMEIFKKAVDEFAAMGGTYIDFNVTIGDPLLDRKLLERARYVKSFPQFTSNGFVTTLQWLHLHNLDEFFTAGFSWVSISTVLSGPQRYKEFFGVDQYDRMLNNLTALLEENRNRKALDIFIGMKPTDEPAEAVLSHPDYRRIKQLATNDLDTQVQDSTHYVDDWQGAVTLPAYLKKRPLYPRAYRPCLLLFKGLMVYSNGQVGACSCRDFEANSDLILGNIKDNSIPELWNGPRLSELRSNWRTRNQIPDICQSCRHYLY